MLSSPSNNPHSIIGNLIGQFLGRWVISRTWKTRRRKCTRNRGISVTNRWMHRILKFTALFLLRTRVMMLRVGASWTKMDVSLKNRILLRILIQFGKQNSGTKRIKQNGLLVDRLSNKNARPRPATLTTVFPRRQSKLLDRTLLIHARRRVVFVKRHANNTTKQRITKANETERSPIWHHDGEISEIEEKESKCPPIEEDALVYPSVEKETPT